MNLQLTKMIDHTLLKPEATSEQIKTLCNEAKHYNFKAVCINPQFVSLAKKVLTGSDVLVCTVIGFPLGANSTESKIYEAKDAIKNGADEIDMVIAIGKVKEADFDYIENEIRQIVKSAAGKTVKVILETALLTDEEIAKASKAASNANAHFVKTSTGFSTRGASLNDIKIMKENIRADVQIKASGGIRSFEDANNYLELGVTRLGTSAGVAIVSGQKSTSSY